MKKFSIIIPVYNNWIYTDACLKSIYAMTGYPSEDFEVLIVDDDSEDGTSLKVIESIKRHPNLRYIPNDRNLGFAGSCNHGAAESEGERLIFLNNDTRVTPGWDKQLVQTLEKDRDTWIVGARCIFPDGTIQHAGVTFPEFFENHIGHIFRNTPRFFPPVLFECEFQCVTAACFIIRKADFIEIKGFDEGYRNGFEDVDLCLRVKSMGKKIIYQPACEIIHYESKSDGRFESMDHNKKLLLQKWRNFIRPDEIDHFRNSLKLAIDEGTLVPVQTFKKEGFKKDLTIYGKYKSSGNESIRFLGSGKANKLVIRKPELITGDYLLITGELISKSTGILTLKYLTWQEPFYSDSKSFDFQIYKGSNIFYFTILAKHIQRELLLEFSKFSADYEVKALDLYSFNNRIPHEEPHIALVCHISMNPEYFKTLSGLLESEFLSKYKVEVLITHDAGLSPGTELLQATKNGYRILTKACAYKDLPVIWNEFITGSSATYVAVFTDGVHLPVGRIERFIELMELNPEISIIHPFLEGLINRQQPGILDYSAAYLFSLRGRNDIPIFLRKACWEEVGGYDTKIPYYFNMDLCFTILSTHNWRSQYLEGIRSQTFRDTLPIAADLKPVIEIIRNDFYKKHASFLMEIAVKAGQYSILLQKTNQLWWKTLRRDPHATLVGSVGIHLRHFLKRF